MFIPLDLTTAGIVPEGTYVATITKVEKKEARDGSEYLNWTLFIPEHNTNVFHVTSLKALKAVKTMLDATGVSYTKEGFDPQDCVGRNVQLTIGVKETPEYGIQNTVNRISKA